MPSFSFLRSTVLVTVLLANLGSGMPVEERAATTTAPACILAPRTTATSSRITTTVRTSSVARTTTRAASARTTTSSTKRQTTARIVTTSRSTTASAVKPSSTVLPEIWQPRNGTQFQIVLKHPLKDYSPTAPIYIIDMYDNPVSTIQKLHSLNRKVICYFSAGSYEDWRTDASKFKKTDYDKPLDPIWVGEWWLDTRSTNVRDIMVERMKLAKSKGCDGVDPDNVDGTYIQRDEFFPLNWLCNHLSIRDRSVPNEAEADSLFYLGYGNDTGFKMTQADGVDYLKFLAKEAHKLGLSIGLKNAPDIASKVVDVLQWEVNEQCLEYNECAKFKSFIDAGKPVFHIEYPEEKPPYSAATKATKCKQASTKGFSTLLKDIQLTDYYEVC